MQRRQWFYFPAVLLAMRIGYRTDGFFVTDVFGPLVLFAAIHTILWLLDVGVMSAFQPRRRAPARMPMQTAPQPTYGTRERPQPQGWQPNVTG
jgi:hypothetical protein